jgi:hypothetical protein
MSECRFVLESLGRGGNLRGRLAGLTTLEVERRRARDSPPYLVLGRVVWIG